MAGGGTGRVKEKNKEGAIAPSTPEFLPVLRLTLSSFPRRRESSNDLCFLDSRLRGNDEEGYAKMEAEHPPIAQHSQEFRGRRGNGPFPPPCS
ncbi:hypothetical protein NUTIK01_31700 [Novosphingobium sp. IK01]|uniref:Uncharacterized protein n=1 Tax=Novosphingobium pituita TaxID=3056842 RepID=A0ABQ6PAY7_9SPHN|nr:hypothetical protein NUTIK01_31700 [Novosphingobium sp. IK01]